jgi:hypothetical protein
MPSLLVVSNQLNKQWGSLFAITINSTPSAPLYQQLAQQLGPILDLICHQYDYPASESTWIRGVRSRVAELINTHGIAASKIGIGVKTVGPIGDLTTASLTSTVATALSTWHSLQRNYPDLRGTYLWSVNLDESAGYPFARQVLDGYSVGARTQLTNRTLDPARACGPIVQVRHA